MASIEIGPLSERLGDEEIIELVNGLEELGAPRLPHASDDSLSELGEVDDGVLAAFLERLDAYDIACEIYLPMEFDGRVEVGDFRIGSAAALLGILEELKDEIEEEKDEDEEESEDEDEEEEDYENLAKGNLKLVWKLLYEGARSALDRHLPLLL